ncbi:MAG: hypothetical protein DWQ31_03625 [Planctomycetota bacterium]|nr:MAG: hypothetical protein DWQ31_03625 [Planctomycetota bacterium]REJ93973.1 MAG: hypothetical protein DWQ35_09415 [Planctomycetota bacterium]REK30953.1 MAG: hypothetical protein DWQ42_01240 [Planctomycetota bacterium]REK38205.1 MAG: hypothetical protein DWQ46_20975 [Planctomycetota bacterium]
MALAASEFWRWCLAILLGGLLCGVLSMNAGPVWADDEADETATEEADEAAEDEGDRPLTREERAAQKAKEKQEKARERLIAAMEKRLSRKKETGYFVLAFETTKYHKGDRGRATPTRGYEVEVFDGRRAAAVSVLEFLAKIKRKQPKRRLANAPPPPQGKYVLVGRFEDRVEADERRQQANNKYQEMAQAFNDRNGGNRIRGGLQANPL